MRQSALAEEAVDELAMASVRESEQQPSPYPVFTAVDLPSAANAPDALVLEAVGDLRNVNALRGGQTLRLGRRLTVVYGDNASGKSGYARVLKKVYRARAVDEILGDVRAEVPSLEPASARFYVSDGTGPSMEVDWQDGESVSGVGRFAVLDAASAALYMRGGALAYGPAGLDVPQRFAEELDRVKRRLAALAVASVPDKTLLQHLANESAAGRFAQSLSSSTTEAEVVEFTSWTPEDEQELADVVGSLARAAIETPAARREHLHARAAALAAMDSRLSEWCAAVDAPNVASVQEAVRDVSDAVRAVEAIDVVGDPDVPAKVAKGEVWLALLQAATHLVETVDQDEHLIGSMTVDRRCVLCWQDVDGEVRRRLERFREHMSGTAIELKRAAEKRLADLVEAIRAVPSTLAPEASAAIADEGISADIRALVKELGDRRDAVLESLEAGSSVAPVADLDPSALDRLGTLRESVEDELSLLSSADAQAQARLTRVEDRARELRTRKALSEASERVRDFIAKMREHQRLESAAARINTRAVSAKASELHAKHMTATYQKLFEEELGELRFRRRRPQLAHKTSKARVEVAPLVSIHLRHLSPEKVFSEGERTAIALACFLAEIRLGSDPIGLIFDDPVSSLDHNVREHVARRLVAAAKDRQVVVFTHDLAFLADLREQASKIQKVDCEFRTLVATDYEAGFVEGEEPFGARNVKRRISALRELIVAAERAARDGDMASLRAHGKDFYERLRSTWERFIEERLFASVVQRLERNVTPGALPRVNYTRELGEKVHEGWRHCSAAIEAHDHAPAQGGQSYRVEDMKADLEDLVAADKAAPAF